MRLLALAQVVTLCIVLPACGGGNSPPTVTPTPTPPARAIITVLLDPNPVIAVPSGDRNYPWAFRVNLQLSDSGGVAFVVTSMQVVITAASTGLTFSSDQNAFVGLKVPANGQQTRQFAWTSYRMDSNGTKEGTFTVRLNFVDDNGFASFPRARSA